MNRASFASLMLVTVAGGALWVAHDAASESVHAAPIAPAALEEPLERCGQAVSPVLTQASDPSGSADREAQEQLVQRVREIERLDNTNDPSCVSIVVAAIARSEHCGSASELVVATLALDDALSASAVADALARDGECVRPIVAGLASSTRPSSGIIEAARAWTLRQADPMDRSSGLVVLGSLAHAARTDAQEELADDLDEMIASELSRPALSEAERVQRIEAAGNAGCSRCAPQLAEALKDRSPTVRRAAVGALRFIPRSGTATSACDVLARDSDPLVRDQAAWALGWQRVDAVERVHCLVRSAARDRSARVRFSSANALASLVPDVDLARSALLELTSTDYPDDRVRTLAARVVIAFPVVDVTQSQGGALDEHATALLTGHE